MSHIAGRFLTIWATREAHLTHDSVYLSVGLHRAGHDWSDLACMHALEEETATHSSILAWRIPGTKEPGGLLSMGSHGVGHDWSDLAAAAVYMCQSYFLNLSYSLLPPLCPQMNEENVINIYNGLLLSHKKEWIWVGFSEVDEPSAWVKEVRKRKANIVC